MKKTRIKFKQFIIVSLLTSIWIHISEVFRYFVVVKPYLQKHLSVIENVASMDVKIFLIWGIWDTLLSFLIILLFWFCSQVLGNTKPVIYINAFFSWSFFFVLFWIGMANMNLTEWKFLILVLPLAFVEMLVASWIVSYLFVKAKIK